MTTPHKGGQRMTERIIRADEVKVGQTVTGIVAMGYTRWRKRPVEKHCDIRKSCGDWPTVTKVHYWEHGEREGDRPTVCVELSDKRGWMFRLAPDDQVTVQQG